MVERRTVPAFGDARVDSDGGIPVPRMIISTPGYPMAGYAEPDDVKAVIDAELSSVDGKEPTDLEINEETGKRLLAVEETACDVMMNLDPFLDASEAGRRTAGPVGDFKDGRKENGGADSAVSGSEEPDQTPETDDDGARQ